MALQTVGQISINDIEGEFGGTGQASLKEYYGVDSGIPTSGQISIKDFYGASSVIATAWTQSNPDALVNYVYTFTSGGQSTFTMFSTTSPEISSKDSFGAAPQGCISDAEVTVNCTIGQVYYLRTNLTRRNSDGATRLYLTSAGGTLGDLGSLDVTANLSNASIAITSSAMTTSTVTITFRAWASAFDGFNDYYTRFYWNGASLKTT